MTSFQIAITPKRRAAGRFIAAVRKALTKVLVEEHASRGMTQAELARRIDVDRSVINRELRGGANMSLGRVAEIAWALGRKPVISFEKDEVAAGVNHPPASANSLTSYASTELSQSGTRNRPGSIGVS